ncbi:Protein SZT2, partial [Armadillidium nasatum]
EFKNLKIFGYQLEKIGNFYYLAVSPDSNRLRNLFSLVPPLGLKTPTPDISNKTMDSKNLSLVSAPIEGFSGEENASTTQDDIPQKSQKVSFGLTCTTEDIAKEHESPKAETKKGNKLMRKKRRERRDSERRGVLGSSDSEEDASSTTKDLSTYKLDSKFMVPKKLITEEQNDISSVNKNKTALDKNMTLRIESEDKSNVKVTSVEVPQGEEESGNNSEFKKDTTAEMLALKPVERIRCGSINLPRTQVSKTEVIRKSASTDDFSPSIHDNEETRLLHSSPAMWNEVPRSKHSSCDGSKISSDHSKSRHSSGGEILKSRHNSGTGSIMGLYSDVSSLFESGQTTEDGCEGDISDLEESTDWITDLDAPQPPEFWILIKIDSVIQTYFHCRRDLDVEQCKAVHKEVVRLLKDQIKLVNQRLLLQDLYDCRICNHLLEPETSEDVWRHEDMKDLEGENSEYLEAAMKFKLGAFACRQVWTKKFELHPRLKLSGKGGMKGIYTLKKTLNPFMVTNRKNMFVYEDSSGVGTNVFYLRLHEKQTPTYGSAVMETRKDDSLSRSSSVVSLGKKQNRDDEIGFQGERRSFIEKDVIVEGVPSTTCQRRNQQDYIILTVHGIAEPGIDIKENLVQMLQKRLDDAVLDAICLMLWDNPHHKLSSEDILVNVYALPYVQALCYYLRQNMIPVDSHLPNTWTQNPKIIFRFLSHRSRSNDRSEYIFKSGTKGLACLALSVIDSHGNAYKKGFNSVIPNAFEEILSETEFEIMTQTGQHIAENDNVVFQFKVWECGRLEFEEMGKCLEEAIKHALWDLSTEYRFLVAPITLSSVLAVSQPSTPVKGFIQFLFFFNE